MNKQKIITKLRALRTTYGTDGATAAEMVGDLRAAGFPTAVVSAAESVYKNAVSVTKHSVGSRLTKGEITKLAIEATLGAAKRNLFGSY